MSIASALINGLAALNLAPSTKSRQLAESLIHESEIERLQSRQATAAELASAEAAEIAAVRAHQKALEPLRARVDELRDSLNKAGLDIAKAAHARAIAAWAASQRIDQLRGSLRQGASPMIAEFVVELRALLEQSYRQRDLVVGRTIEDRPVVAWHNEVSVQARVTAIRTALAECGEVGRLPYLALDDASLQVELDKLRASIPEVDEAPEKILRLVGAIT